MLTIRDEQMRILGLPGEQEFAERVVQMLRRDYPAEFAAKPDAEIREFVRKTMDRGREYRITGQGAMLVFFELMVEYGEWLRDSPDTAWAETILRHPKMPDQLRLSIVRDRFSERSHGRRIVRA